MSSKEEYEQNLDNLVKFLTPIHCVDEKRRKPIEKMLSTFRELLDEYNKLTHQPNLKECLKKWEERGFEVVDNSFNYLYVRNYNKNIRVLFRKFELSYIVEDFYDDKDSLVVPYDLHNLIHKTLKALEEMKK